MIARACGPRISAVVDEEELAPRSVGCCGGTISGRSAAVVAQTSHAVVGRHGVTAER